MTWKNASELLDELAIAQPDLDFLRFREENIDYVTFARRYREMAARLAHLGVGPGDIVPVFLANVAASVECWFALLHLGAVWAPINTEFRGEQVSRALNQLGSRCLVAGTEFLPQILEVSQALEHLDTVLVHGQEELLAPGGLNVVDLASLPASPCPQKARVERASVAMIQFTSGSTGLPKAVQLSHGYLTGQGRTCSDLFSVQTDDVLYCPFPLYHWDATIGTVMAALCGGGTAALARRFSVSGFWDDIDYFGATIFDFMGATLTFLYRQPETPQDADNPVRLAWGVPMPEFRDDFERRFDLVLNEAYGSTEGGVPVFQRPGQRYPQGSCGRVAPGWQLRLLDDSGNEVPAGRVGEIVTRPDDPTQIMNGYLGMPGLNAELIRDGWYYTGDLGRLDEQGNLYFSGRKKDVIRRRGENISALEVEQIIAGHPAVSEVAAYGLPSEFSEEEVAVAVVCRPGKRLDREELLRFCDGRMARYMLPEHLLMLPELPKTPTEKVAKARLREIHLGRLRG